MEECRHTVVRDETQVDTGDRTLQITHEWSVKTSSDVHMDKKNMSYK